MKFVLVRMQKSGALFVIVRTMWEEMRGLDAPFYESEVVAESDEMLSLMRLKKLTVEET